MADLNFDTTVVSTEAITGMINQFDDATNWSLEVQTRPIGNSGDTGQVLETIADLGMTFAATTISLTSKSNVEINVGYEVYKVHIKYGSVIMYTNDLGVSEEQFPIGGNYIIETFSITFANDVD